MTKKKKAFTLVELLVVISIIALLVSILLPALNKAREQAKMVVCKASERSTGQAMILYAADYNGHIIPGNMWNGITIMHWLPDENGNSVPQPCNEGQLLAGDYLPTPSSSDNIIYCPSASTKAQGYTTFDKTAGNPTSPTDWRDFYRCWLWPKGSQTLDGRNSSPSGIVDNNYVFRASMDGGDNGLYRYGAVKGAPLDKIMKYPVLCDGYSQSPDYDFHAHTINIVFGDGHVETFDMNTNKGLATRQWLADDGKRYQDEYFFMVLDDLFSLPRWQMLSGTLIGMINYDNEDSPWEIY